MLIDWCTRALYPLHDREWLLRTNPSVGVRLQPQRSCSECHRPFGAADPSPRCMVCRGEWPDDGWRLGRA